MQFQESMITMARANSTNRQPIINYNYIGLSALFVGWRKAILKMPNLVVFVMIICSVILLFSVGWVQLKAVSCVVNSPNEY